MEQRVELMEKMRVILSKFEGDFLGTFVDLQSMVEEHTLVKELRKQ